MVIDNNMPIYLKDLANTAQRCRSHSSFNAPAQEPLCPHEPPVTPFRVLADSLDFRCDYARRSTASVVLGFDRV